MKISIEISIIRSADGRKGLRVWPSFEGTEHVKMYAASAVLVVLTAISLWAISSTPDPNIKPDQTVVIFP